MTPQPNHDASLAFLKWWLPNGPWCLAAIHPDERDRKDYIKSTVFTPRDSDIKILKWLSHHGDFNLYYTANVAKPGVARPQREELEAMICLHADVDPRVSEDLAAEQERIRIMLASPRPKDLPPPTLTVFTGGGYQALWRFKEPVPIRDLAHAEDLARYNLQVRNLLGGDSAQDLARVLRLPGTINWPNKLKREKKGRTPELAFIVEQHTDRLYELREFIQAPQIQDAEQNAGPKGPPRVRRGNRRTVEVGSNVMRLASVDELPDSVPTVCKVIIVQGDNPDDFTQFNGDRSKAVWYVTCELVRNNVPDETIFSILTDPGFGISAHVLDQPRGEKYAKRQIARAHEQAIDADLRAFNDQYAVIANYGGRCRVIEELWDPRLQRSAISAMTFEDFRNAHLHLHKELSDKEKMPLAEWWLRQKHRRQYDRVVFVPNGDEEIDGCYNLWRGFGVEPAPGDCSLFLDHVRTVLCGGDEDQYLYLLRWMANAVQFPQEPGQVAVVLKGRMGTGKSFFARTFGRLFGRHYLAVSDSKRLVSNFNAHLRDCVLLFADEAFYAGDKKHESTLKALITEDSIAIEAKTRDIEVGANCLHVIMASNEDWAVPASMDDRRFFVLDVKDSQRNSHGYFAKIQSQLLDGGYSALLDTLLKMDLSTFNVRVRPDTPGLRVEKAMSLPPVEAWWYGRLLDGEIIFPDSRSNAGWPSSHPIPKQQLFSEVRRALPNHMRGTLNDVRLGRLLGKVMPPSTQEIRPEGSRIWRDHDNVERSAIRPRCYVLPPLSECRAHWEKIGAPIVQPWPEQEDSLDGIETVPTNQKHF